MIWGVLSTIDFYFSFMLPSKQPFFSFFILSKKQLPVRHTHKRTDTHTAIRIHWWIPLVELLHLPINFSIILVSFASCPKGICFVWVDEAAIFAFLIRLFSLCSWVTITSALPLHLFSSSSSSPIYCICLFPLTCTLAGNVMRQCLSVCAAWMVHVDCARMSFLVTLPSDCSSQYFSAWWQW